MATVDEVEAEVNGGNGNVEKVLWATVPVNAGELFRGTFRWVMLDRVWFVLCEQVSLQWMIRRKGGLPWFRLDQRMPLRFPSTSGSMIEHICQKTGIGRDVVGHCLWFMHDVGLIALSEERSKGNKPVRVAMVGWGEETEHFAEMWRRAMDLQQQFDLKSREGWDAWRVDFRKRRKVKRGRPERAHSSQAGMKNTSSSILPGTERPFLPERNTKTQTPLTPFLPVKGRTQERTEEELGSGGKGDINRPVDLESSSSGDLDLKDSQGEVARQASQEPAESLLVPSGEHSSGEEASERGGFPQLDFSGNPTPTTHLERRKAEARAKFERARERVATEDTPFKQIAMEEGYYDLAHLSHEFKKRERISPTEYRNRAREAEVEA